MRDYFAEFLLNPQRATIPVARPSIQTPRLGLGAPTQAAPIKHHMMWAVVATAIGLVSWKASRWFARYQLLKKQAEG